MLQLLSYLYIFEPSCVWGAYVTALCSKGKVWGHGGSGNSNYAVSYLLAGIAKIIASFIYLTWKLSANCLQGWSLRRLKSKSQTENTTHKCSRRPLRGHHTFTRVRSPFPLLREGFSEVSLRRAGETRAPSAGGRAALAARSCSVPRLPPAVRPHRDPQLGWNARTLWPQRCRLTHRSTSTEWWQKHPLIWLQIARVCATPEQNGINLNAALIST